MARVSRANSSTSNGTAARLHCTRSFQTKTYLKAAIGYKQTFGGVDPHVRFTPECGHKWVWRFMSASDPKRTLVTGIRDVRRQD